MIIQQALNIKKLFRTQTESEESFQNVMHNYISLLSCVTIITICEVMLDITVQARDSL